MISFGPQLAEWARSSEALLQQSLANPTPATVGVVFAGGLLTSLGPCSLSLLPVTLAYLAGFGASSANPGISNGPAPWQRSLCFAAGVVGALVLLGLVSGLLGRIYGQIPGLIPTVVAVLALLMGLNLLGILKFPLPPGPDPNVWRSKVPAPL
ncbi:MAG: cytochrome c biogenesis protein CcdA, partial [Cyanobium sp.]